MKLKNFKTLDIITLKKVASLFVGNYKTSFFGSGMEFEDLRKYESGDDVRSIDWLASAKSEKVYIKKFQESRELPTIFAFNISDSMNFGIGEKTKYDTLKEIYAILAISSSKNNDPMGSIFYDKNKIIELEAKRGKTNLIKSIKKLDEISLGYELLSNNQKETINKNIKNQISTHNSEYISESIKIESKLEGKNFINKQNNIDNLINHLFIKKTNKNIIFIFSDELKIGNEQKFGALCQKNDVVFVHISDNFENNLIGKGIVNLGNIKENFFINLNNKTKKELYITERKLEIENFKKFILKSSGSFLKIDNNTNLISELYKFFKLRQNLI